MKLLGNLTMSDVVIPVNVTLLSGSAHLWMTICGTLVNVIVKFCLFELNTLPIVNTLLTCSFHDI